MIPRKLGFEGWYCSANWFFLHGNNVNGKYYTNKDCRVTLNQTQGAIANMDTMPAHMQQIKEQLLSNTLPMMRCVQKKCLCGTCAPKSLHQENVVEIMKIYNI